MQQSIEAAKLRIEHLEARQKHKFNRMREGAINRSKDKLAVMCMGAMASDPALDLSNGNPNLREAAFAAQATSNGWTVTRRGWPDFMCWKGDDVIFVEVKPDGKPLDPHQKVIMGKLIKLGLRCFLWTPKSGMVRRCEKP
jgi:hypothetical protein